MVQCQNYILPWRPSWISDKKKKPESVSLTFHSVYTEPSIGASHQVSVHLAKQLQRRFLEIDQSETRMACGGLVY